MRGSPAPSFPSGPAAGGARPRAPRRSRRLRGLAPWALAAAACVAGAGQTRAADAIPGEQWCDGRPIDRIAFAGNRVTKPEVMARELPLAAGDPCALDDVIDGLQPLQDLGLFRGVHAELELDEDRDLVLRYTVREKFFFIGVPRLSRSTDGVLRAGVSLEWDNFLGRLHEMALVSEWRQEDDGEGHEGFVNRLDYEVPRLLGTPYGFGFRLRAERRGMDFERDGVEYGVGERRVLGADLGLSRWVVGDGTQGTRVFVGTGVEHRAITVDSGEVGFARDGLDVGFRAGIEWRRVHRDRWRRTGHRYGAAVGFANRALGSDFAWHRVDLWGSLYLPVGSGIRNLNLRAALGASDGAPFGERFYSVGGGERLRGPDKGTREGDVQLLVNTELLTAFATRPAIRWVVFADVGNAWTRDAVDAADLDWGAGLGLRWKVEAISDADLRVDLAWDHARERVRPYLSTKLTF